MFRTSLYWWLIFQFVVFVNSFKTDKLKDYDGIKPEETHKAICSGLYERCEHWECCKGYECAVANKGDNMLREDFLFFCQDPTKNETENMLGLNDFVFWNPDVFLD